MTIVSNWDMDGYILKKEASRENSKTFSHRKKHNVVSVTTSERWNLLITNKLTITHGLMK